MHVLRCFDNDNGVHIDGSVDPMRDKETMAGTSTQDLETVEKRLEKVSRAARTGNKAIKELKVLNRLQQGLPVTSSFVIDI